MKIKFLTLFFIVFSTYNVAFSQKKSKSGNWEKQLQQTWKVVNIDFPKYGNELNRGLNEIATISLKENGLAWIYTKNGLVIDSFFTFEKEGNNYLKISALALRITKINDAYLELAADIPLVEISRVKILLIPEKETPGLDISDFARTWKSASYKGKYDYDIYDDYDNFMGSTVFIIDLKKDGSFTRLEDSILRNGKWNISGNKLTLNPAKGKTETYFVRSVGRRSIALMPENNGSEQITLSNSNSTPEEYLARLKIQKEQKLLAEKKKAETKKVETQVEYKIEAPVQEIEQPMVIEEVKRPKYKTPEELLTDTFVASGYVDLLTNQPAPIEGTATLTFLKNNTFSLTYRSRTEKGSWKLATNRNTMILIRNGVETYVPYSYNTDYKNNQQIRSLTLTVVLPGEKKLKTVNLVPAEDKKK